MTKRETHEWYMSKVGFLCHHCGATSTKETMTEVNKQDCVWPAQSLQQGVKAEQLTCGGCGAYHFQPHKENCPFIYKPPSA